MSDNLQPILLALQEVEEDSSTPKNVKEKISLTIKVLNTDAELAIKVSKALHELEYLSEDSNVQPYTRTQIFNIVSLLEFL